VQFDNGVLGIAFNLERDSVGVIIMGDYSEIKEGSTVRSTGRIASVPVVMRWLVVWSTPWVNR